MTGRVNYLYVSTHLFRDTVLGFRAVTVSSGTWCVKEEHVARISTRAFVACEMNFEILRRK